MVVWVATKHFERVGGGECILGVRSTEIAAMELCIEHDPNHLHWGIESFEVDGEYGIASYIYVDGTLQTTLSERKRLAA